MFYCNSGNKTLVIHLLEMNKIKRVTFKARDKSLFLLQVVSGQERRSWHSKNTERMTIWCLTRASRGQTSRARASREQTSRARASRGQTPLLLALHIADSCHKTNVEQKILTI